VISGFYFNKKGWSFIKNIWNFYGGIYYEYNKSFDYKSPAGHRMTDQRMAAWANGDKFHEQDKIRATC